MKCGGRQHGAAHVCLPRKLSPRWPPSLQQPQTLCSPAATIYTLAAAHSDLQQTPSHRSAALMATVAVRSSKGCDGCTWRCQCHSDNAHHHSRHSSRHIKGRPCKCYSHRVLCNSVACSNCNIEAAAAAPADAQSAAHNVDDSRNEHASTPPSAPLATDNPQPAQAARGGGDGDQGTDSGNGGGTSSGNGDDADGFGERPKFPVWYTVWVWCTALLYLVWRWQWRRDRRLAAEQFEREQAAEEQLKQDWQNFAQQYKIQAGAAAAPATGKDSRR